MIFACSMYFNMIRICNADFALSLHYLYSSPGCHVLHVYVWVWNEKWSFERFPTTSVFASSFQLQYVIEGFEWNFNSSYEQCMQLKWLVLLLLTLLFFSFALIIQFLCLGFFWNVNTGQLFIWSTFIFVGKKIVNFSDQRLNNFFFSTKIIIFIIWIINFYPIYIDVKKSKFHITIFYIIYFIDQEYVICYYSHSCCCLVIFINDVYRKKVMRMIEYVNDDGMYVLCAFW